MVAATEVTGEGSAPTSALFNVKCRFAASTTSTSKSGVRLSAETPAADDAEFAAPRVRCESAGPNCVAKAASTTSIAPRIKLGRLARDAEATTWSKVPRVFRSGFSETFVTNGYEPGRWRHLDWQLRRDDRRGNSNSRFHALGRSGRMENRPFGGRQGQCYPGSLVCMALASRCGSWHGLRGDGLRRAVAVKRSRIGHWARQNLFAGDPFAQLPACIVTHLHKLQAAATFGSVAPRDPADRLDRCARSRQDELDLAWADPPSRRRPPGNADRPGSRQPGCRRFPARSPHTPDGKAVGAGSAAARSQETQGA